MAWAGAVLVATRQPRDKGRASLRMLLFGSGGTSAACGWNDDWGRCELPALVGDPTYVPAAAGGVHAVVLRSDGAAVGLRQECSWSV